MLGKRLITALIAIPVVILAVWFSRPEYAFPLLTVLAAAWGLAAVYEFYRLTGVSRNLPLTVFGLAWTLLFILQPHLDYSYAFPVIITSGLVLSMILLVFSPKKDGVFSQWAWMTAGAFYAGWLLGLLVTLRLDAGRNWIYLVLFANIASDSAAYFFGRALGKHKMAPSISPGKSWEGAAAGVGGAVIISRPCSFPWAAERRQRWGCSSASSGNWETWRNPCSNAIPGSRIPAA